MRDKFLEIVEEIQDTKIEEALYRASTANELKEVGKNFRNENQQIVEKSEDWGYEFENNGSNEKIFEEGEEIEDPMAIAIVIYLCNSIYVTEEEIFEDKEDFRSALEQIENHISKKLAELMKNKVLCAITAEDIFDSDSDEE